MRLRALVPALDLCAPILPFVAAAALLGGCGTDAVGEDACRKIESARCAEAPRCGIDLTRPVHAGAPGTDVEACIQYYGDACLHGLATSVTPASADVDACVKAIHAGTCDAVTHPEKACTWLVPPAPEAGVDGAVDGGTTTGDAATD